MSCTKTTFRKKVVYHVELKSEQLRLSTSVVKVLV